MRILISYYRDSFLLALAVEALGRQSLAEAFRFLRHSPANFLCNMGIIALTISPALLARKRRRFFLSLLSILWLVLGVTNCVIRFYRMTPFSAEDFRLLPALMLILKNYVTPPAIAALGLLAAGTLVLVAVLYRKLPRDRKRRHILLTFLLAAGSSGALALGSNAVLSKKAAFSENFQNLAEAYEDYGFAYCFLNSMLHSGIAKPEGYSAKTMTKLCAELKEENTPIVSGPEEGQPDIIMVQLESVFDPLYMRKEYAFSEDPIPFFRSLKEEYPSGFLYVPVVGAGTVNTEFEILTGMSTGYFGAGEYPYNTVLRSTPVESLPNILASRGYESTVIHNNTGTFYNRSGVFSMLGFDRFIPSEYMYDLTYTPTNWARDAVLPGLIGEVLERSEGPDFIYTITVQSHGRYPSEPLLENPQITVTGAEGVNCNPVEYYVNQLQEVDEMIRELVELLEERGKPAILMLYGDHLPSLGVDGDTLLQPDLYETEYVIWSNTGAKSTRRDLQAENLSTAVMEAAGIPDGIIPRFHRVFTEREDYAKGLHLLEYDMLYGQGYVYREFASELGVNRGKDGTYRAYRPSQLCFGLEPIRVDGCAQRNEQWVVTGSGFNESSKIVVDDRIQDTEYVDFYTLRLTGSLPKDAARLKVMQCDENLEPIGEGSNWIDLY